MEVLIQKIIRFTTCLRLVALAAWLGILTGCAPIQHYPKEDFAATARPHFIAGRRLYQREDFAGAIEEFKKAIAESPRCTMAHRLYQDSCVAICRIEPLIAEYEELRNRDPHDPLYRYLYGRLQVTSSARKREFEKALESDPGFAWAWNGLATVAHQEKKLWAAERDYKKAMDNSASRIAEPMIGLGKIYGLRGQYEKAYDILRRAARVDPVDPLSHLVMAVIARDQGASRRTAGSAMVHCEQAIERVPNCRSALQMYRDLVCNPASEGIGAADLERGRRCFREALKEFSRDPELLGTLGVIEMLLGNRDAAISCFEKAKANGLCPADYANHMRLLYVQKGDYERALRVWHEKVPEKLIESPENVVAERYAEVSRTTAEAEARPDDSNALLGLARAYARAGWVKEALAVADGIGEKHPDLEAAAALREEIRGHLDFCARIEQLFRRGYVRFQTTRRYGSLRRVIEEVEGLGAAATGRKFERKTGWVDYPLMGRITDHTYPPRSDMMKYFDNYNQMLIMGKPLGGAPVECLLMTVISREPKRKSSVWGVVVPNDRVVAGDLKVSGYHETLEHRRTGGQTLASFFYTNIDTVWQSCFEDIRSLNSLWRPNESSGPPSTRLPPLLIDRISSEPTRLLDLAYREDSDAEPMRYFLNVLDLVDRHELGHVADARTHLPLSRYFLRDLILFFQSGFSLTNVLAYTERNAELTALVHASSPRLVLGSLTEFIELGFDESPHAVGYRKIIERLVREIYSAPDEYPEIDTASRIVDQLTKLPPDRIRSLARRLAEEWKIPQRVREIEK